MKLFVSFFMGIACLLTGSVAAQQVTVNINTLAPKKVISPYIFGKNNSLSDQFLGDGALTAAEWQHLRDLGITMFRENGGNNATKYNWRRKLSSHPDWYNNVYAHDWDFAARSLGDNIPNAQGMWAFQLIGKAAASTSHNFNDWGYNRSQWWPGVRQNLCGGGTLNPDSGGNALVEGNPSLYLENWNADSTTGILDRWFGNSGIGLDADRIRYWSMDNEPEIWNGTHDDVWPVQPSAEEFMQMYFDVAKKARAKFPGIKLVGPVPANEWQWYNWNGSSISYNGKEYVWLEYFILRVAEEQQASGIRLLDVLDIHFYPGETSPVDITQLHRIFFDTTYQYPGANGVKRSGAGGWDGSLNREYIFKRCNDWLIKYIGQDHGVTFSVTETALAKKDNPTLTANWYASMLGEFARQGVEIFTPWDWTTGMSEVIHLFTHYGQEYIIPALSSDEYHVSAYPMMNEAGDSMTVILVNRNLAGTQEIDLNINDFDIKDGNYKLYTLSGLPSNETFVSHNTNALKQNDISITNNNIALAFDSLTVSALVVKRNTTVYNNFGELLATAEAENGSLTGVTTSVSLPGYSGTGYVSGLDTAGDRIVLSLNVPSKDVYRIVIRYAGTSESNQNLTVNSSFTATVHFPSTAAFDRINAGGFVLNAGSNSVVLSRYSGEAEIDNIEVYRMEKNEFEIVPELVDTAATDETKELYQFLQYQFGERIISGQTHDYYNQVKTLAGKSPMLRAGDFQSYTDGYPYLWDDDIDGHTFGKLDNGTVSSLMSWYNASGNKGIISLHWHWHSPSGGSVSTNTFYTDQTNFDVRQAVIPGTPEYNLIIRDIDEIAIQLKRFQTAGIPILWRPLHEAGGGWFWWGAKGAAPCLALWDILIERLKNYHNLHNLIWVWSTPEPDWFPGNDKVDMIGYDSYPGEFNYTSQKTIFDNLYMITRGEKLIAMTENGPIPDPDACLEQDAPWLYFMSWSNLVASQNTTAHIRDAFNNPIVLTLESTNAKTGFDWRSSLYPIDWMPGYKDSQGRFLHDFSYAGYHSGVAEIPHITENITDVTQPPYNADNTGFSNVTAVIQQALDDVGQAGGGVVYLPAGKYLITAIDSSFSLRIAHDSTILRGAGHGLTFLQNVQTNMRNKDIIRVSGNDADWFKPQGNSTPITFNLIEPTRVIPVQSVAGFNIGDPVIITSVPTDEFIAEHKMTGYWSASAIKGVAFLRRIDTIDVKNNLIVIDAPTRYALKTRDQAMVYTVNQHISECGIEDLSIGNIENMTSGWDEESYTQPGTGAYDSHFSHAIQFRNAENCWLKNVHTFRPEENAVDIHLLSNGVRLNQSRFITVDSCNFEKPQYKGGGGNGYMYTLESNDCLVKNSRANHGRHNYDFKYPYSNGNVIHKSRGENSKYASDFHMYLSMANLFDACVFNGDFLESAFRPYGTTLHGYTSTQSVFYNTAGEAYHPDKNYLVDSRQFGWGYIIGTSGPAYEVSIDPAEGSVNGYLFNSSPRDFTEGIGDGAWLVPASLYLDQLNRRQNDSTSNRTYHVSILVKDAESNGLMPDSEVRIYNETRFTGEDGLAAFGQVPAFFVINVSNPYCLPVENKQFMIYSDTTLTVYLTKKEFQVTIRLIRDVTFEPLVMNSVKLGSTTEVTNESGETYFTFQGGTHAYLVQRTHYQTAEGSVLIGSDTIIVLYLLQTHANIRIKLREGTTPVNNVTVVLNETTLISNYGDVLFKDLPVSVSYPFQANKNGYAEETGSVYLSTDTVVVVQMTQVPVSAKEIPASTAFTCWPNPAGEFLNVTLPENCGGGILQITDLSGTELMHQIIEKPGITIAVNKFMPGAYLLRLIANDRTWVKYFVKN